MKYAYQVQRYYAVMCDSGSTEQCSEMFHIECFDSHTCKAHTGE